MTTGQVAGGTSGTFHFNGGALLPTQDNTAFFSGLGTADAQAGGARIDTNGFNVTVAQNLVHDTSTNAAATDGGLTKGGTGTLMLLGASTYTGPTQVNAGMLAITGSLQGTGGVTVAGGATLAGTGRVAGAVQVQAGGTLVAGLNGAGVLTVQGNLALSNTLNPASPATAVFTLGGTTPGSGYTQVQVGGQLTLANTALVLNGRNGFRLAVGQTFYLFDEPGSGALAAGVFANAPTGVYTDAAGNTSLVNYAANNPANNSLLFNDVSVTVLTVVPEPSTWALVALGLTGLGVVARRRARLV